nr:transposase [Ferrimicrobium acidiphilum]
MGRHLIAPALELEVTQVLADLKSTGRDVVLNGYLPEHSVTTAIADVEVPRIRSRDGNGSINFSSKLIPSYLRRSKSIDALATYAYLKGVSERDMAQVLKGCPR